MTTDMGIHTLHLWSSLRYICTKHVNIYGPSQCEWPEEEERQSRKVFYELRFSASSSADPEQNSKLLVVTDMTIITDR